MHYSSINSWKHRPLRLVTFLQPNTRTMARHPVKIKSFNKDLLQAGDNRHIFEGRGLLQGTDEPNDLSYFLLPAHVRKICSYCSTRNMMIDLHKMLQVESHPVSPCPVPSEFDLSRFQPRSVELLGTDPQRRWSQHTILHKGNEHICLLLPFMQLLLVESFCIMKTFWLPWIRGIQLHRFSWNGCS